MALNNDLLLSFLMIQRQRSEQGGTTGLKLYNAAVMRFTSLYSVLVRKHITLYLKPLKPLTGDFRGATINI